MLKKKEKIKENAEALFVLNDYLELIKSFLTEIEVFKDKNKANGNKQKQ